MNISQTCERKSVAMEEPTEAGAPPRRGTPFFQRCREGRAFRCPVRRSEGMTFTILITVQRLMQPLHDGKWLKL